MFCLDLQHPAPDYNGDHYGAALCVVGDVDGDGVGDFAIGETSFGTKSSFVDLRSGATGKLIWRIDTLYTDANNLHLAAAGDIDRDGVPDVLLSVSGRTRPEVREGMVRVLSGRDGHVLHAFQEASKDSPFGCQIAGNVDFDGDGTPDIVVSAVSETNTDLHISIYSGRDSRLLRSIDCLSNEFACGPDFDADGTPDIVTMSLEGLGTPHWAILSGRDGHTIRNLIHEDTLNETFHSRAMRADVSHTSAATSPQILLSCFEWTDSNDYSYVHAYDVNCSSPSLTVQSFDLGGMCGMSITCASDVDGDGLKDIVAGAPESQKYGFFAGEVDAWSGATGKPLWRVPGQADIELGACVVGGIDVDDDCCEDIIASAVWMNGADCLPGQVWVISGRTGKTLRVLQRDSP